MAKKKENEESFLNKYLLKIALAIMVIGVILITLAPYLFTQLSSTYSLIDKGQIGDAIGGTTAPIVGLLGSILVFLSLYAQIQANRLVLKEFEDERERYKLEQRERESERQKDLLRYQTSEKERAFDKKTQEQNELFRTLLEMVQTHHREIENLVFEGIRGIDAIRYLAEQKAKGLNLPHFNLIEVVARSVKQTVKLAEQSQLRKEQNTLLAEQAFLITSKFEIATYGLRESKNSFSQALENVQQGRDVAGTPLTGFLALLIEIYQIAIELRNKKEG